MITYEYKYGGYFHLVTVFMDGVEIDELRLVHYVEAMEILYDTLNLQLKGI